MQKLVEVQNISMNYHTKEGEVSAISQIDFSVSSGEFISIVGPSGCGKSTLLSVIAGLLAPSSGHVLVGGRPSTESREQIGYMLQKDQLFPWRNILSNATLGLEIQKKLTMANITYTHELLEKYGLGDFKKNYPSELSGGMRQRAALIRTLATRPRILLLDEPFSALDYQTRLTVSDEISGILQAEKVTAILVTHDISEAISLSDRVLVLTKRPSKLANIHKIDLGGDAKGPIMSRKSVKFPEYFNKIWKELDISD